MTTIGKRIFDRRTEIGMSQEELAKKVGYRDRSSIARIESGERDVRQKMIVEFAKALNVSLTWLMGFGEQKNAPAESSESTKPVDIIDEPELIELLAESHTETELRKVVNGLSRDNKLKLIEYARLLLLSQAQADREDQE